MLYFLIILLGIGLACARHPGLKYCDLLYVLIYCPPSKEPALEESWISYCSRPFSDYFLLSPMVSGYSFSFYAFEFVSTFFVFTTPFILIVQISVKVFNSYFILIYLCVHMCVCESSPWMHSIWNCQEKIQMTWMACCVLWTKLLSSGRVLATLNH